MPVDVRAEVIANTPLSSDYNVLALAAPSIAAVAQPGQFGREQLRGAGTEQRFLVNMTTERAGLPARVLRMCRYLSPSWLTMR